MNSTASHYTFRPGRCRVRRRRVRPWLLQHRHRAGPLDRDAGAATPGSARLSVGSQLGTLRADALDQGGVTPCQSPMGAVVVVGGTRAIGLEIARHYRGPRRPRRPHRSSEDAVDGGRGRDRGRTRRADLRPVRARDDRRRPGRRRARCAGSSWPRSTATRTRSPSTTSGGRSGWSRSSSSATPKSSTRSVNA